jgi:phosphatidylglycerophosphatase C
MSTPTTTVAAFDVDGTLTRIDCVRPFLERLVGRPGLLALPVRHPVEFVAGAARRDRDRLKALVVGRSYEGRPVDDVAAVGRSFATHVHDTMLRDDVVARLRWHQASGHRTVIVSASLRSYLAPLGEALGIDAVLCTDVVAVDGRYTAQLDGGNCRAAEKRSRLRTWLAAEGLTGSTLWAYGDSRGDREMLDDAHHPVWVQGTTVQPVPSEIQS